MPIIKSARKRVRVAQKATILNVKTKRNLKVAVKAMRSSLKNSKKAANELKKAQSAIDIAVKKGVIHKNKAARKKRQLTNAAKIITGVTVAAGVAHRTTSKKKEQKPSTKKASLKSPKAKSPTKKPTTKKTSAKTK